MFFALDLFDGEMKIVSVCETKDDVYPMVMKYYDALCSGGKKYNINTVTENGETIYYLVLSEVNVGYVYNSNVDIIIGKVKVLEFALQEAIDQLINDKNAHRHEGEEELLRL